MTIETVADFYSETEVGRELLNRGSAHTLEALLRDRFGEHPDIPAIAGELAHRPDQVAAVHAVTRAATLRDVLDEMPTSSS